MGPMGRMRRMGSLGIGSDQLGDTFGGAAFADAVLLGDVGGGGADGAVLDDLQGHGFFLGLGAQTGAAENEDGAVDGDGGLDFGKAAVGEPGVLLLEEKL